MSRVEERINLPQITVSAHFARYLLAKCNDEEALCLI